MAVKFTLTGEHLPYGELQSTETNNWVQSKITHEFTAETLDEILPQLKAFLLGLQYNPEGDLEFVDNFTDKPFKWGSYSDGGTTPLVHAKDIKQFTTKGNSE